MIGMLDLEACHRALLRRRGGGDTITALADEIGVSETIIKYMLRDSYYRHSFTTPIRYRLRRWLGGLTPQEVFLERFKDGESIQDAAENTGLSISEAHATLRKALRIPGEERSTRS
jgi:hypothetical protein